jgi:flagellar biogenesis protein FliO
MTDALLRLMWALPLVLVIGIAAALVLKRFVLPGVGRPAPQGQRLTLRESLSISQDTRLHLLDIDGRAHLVIESGRQTVLQWAPAAETPRVPGPFVPRWAQRFYNGTQR